MKHKIFQQTCRHVCTAKIRTAVPRIIPDFNRRTSFTHRSGICEGSGDALRLFQICVLIMKQKRSDLCCVPLLLQPFVKRGWCGRKLFALAKYNQKSKSASKYRLGQVGWGATWRSSPSDLRILCIFEL